MTSIPFTGEPIRHVYRTMSLFTRTMMWVFPAVFVIMIVTIFLDTPGNLVSRISSNAFMIVLFAATMAYAGTRVVHTIVLRETDAAIELRTMFRTVVFPVADLVEVRPSFLQWGQIVVKSAHGSIMVPHFDRLLDVLKWIRRRNPTVPLTGM